MTAVFVAAFSLQTFCGFNFHGRNKNNFAFRFYELINDNQLREFCDEPFRFPDIIILEDVEKLLWIMGDCPFNSQIKFIHSGIISSDAFDLPVKGLFPNELQRACVTQLVLSPIASLFLPTVLPLEDKCNVAILPSGRPTSTPIHHGKGC